jgi:NDP-sugar pyrophosphorylase family protein
LSISKARDENRFGNVKVNKNGRIISFAEKRQIASSALINSGIYIINSEILKFIPKNMYYSLEYDMIPDFLYRGVNIFGYKFQGYFINIGIPEGFYNFCEREGEKKGFKIENTSACDPRQLL